jgi:hypothetical protein
MRLARIEDIFLIFSRPRLHDREWKRLETGLRVLRDGGNGSGSGSMALLCGTEH